MVCCLVYFCISVGLLSFQPLKFYDGMVNETIIEFAIEGMDRWLWLELDGFESLTGSRCCHYFLSFAAQDFDVIEI